jgi:HEAT repeat protein
MFKWLAGWLGVGEPTSGRGLREQARNTEPEQRQRAAEALGAINEPWACDELLMLLKDMVGSVRDAARESLRKKGTAATSVLIKALEDADPRLATTAAELLGDLKDLDAVRPLLLVMKFGSVEIRAAATRALIRYGRSAIPGLMLAIQDPDPWARMQGESILAEIQTNERAAAVNPPSAPAAPNSPLQ